MKCVSHIMSIICQYEIQNKCEKTCCVGNTGIVRAGPQRRISYKTPGLKQREIEICSESLQEMPLLF